VLSLTVKIKAAWDVMWCNLVHKLTFRKSVLVHYPWWWRQPG